MTNGASTVVGSITESIDTTTPSGRFMFNTMRQTDLVALSVAGG
jgi:hypothetical protein